MKYRALTPINHDGQNYNSGAEIELTSLKAAPLLEVSAIEPYHKPFSKASANTSNEGAENV